MRSPTARLLFSLLLAGGVLAACGDDDSASSGDDAAAAGDGAGTGRDGGADGDDEAGEAGGDGVGTGAAGTVTVDGTTYAIDETITCDPAEIEVEMVERELELQGLGSGDGGTVQIDVYIEELAGMPTHDVSWSGPEGIFGGQMNDMGGTWTDLETNATAPEAPIRIEGDRVSGQMSVGSARGDGDTVDVTFDLAVPAEHSRCR